MAETGLRLRTAAPSGDWRSMILTAPSGGVSKGQMAKIQNTVGFYMQDADAGVDVAFCYHAEKIEVPKLQVSGTDIFAAGQKVYFSEADAAVTATAGSNLWTGIALKAATAADEYVLIDFKGDKAT